MTILLGVLSSLASAVMFLLLLSRLRPRIEISEVIAHSVVAGRAVDRFSVKIRNQSRSQLLDVRIKASFIVHYDARHPRVGRGTHLEFEYPTLFDLAKAERRRDAAGKSTFEFSFKTPLQPLMALSDDWCIRIAVSAAHSLSGLGAIAKRNILGPGAVELGSFAGGTSMAVVTDTPPQRGWKPLSGPSVDRHLLAELMARVSSIGATLACMPRSDINLIQKGDEFDVVSSADLKSEALLCEVIADLFPEDGVIAEEVTRVETVSGAWWLIDPLDGTVNFAGGDRCWGISLGRQLNDVLTLSLLVFPEIEETYFAVRGQGAYRNGERLEARMCDPREAVIATRFGMSQEDREKEYAVVGRLLSSVRDVRRTGCTAYDLAQVASGVYAGYAGRGLGIWDGAATLLIDESGGTWCDWNGQRRLDSGHLIAASHHLLPFLQGVVTESETG